MSNGPEQELPLRAEVDALRQQVSTLERILATHLASWRERTAAERGQASTADVVASRLAHDVNTPLMAIKAHLALLRRQLGDDSAAANVSLDAVACEVDRIAAVIRALRELAPARAPTPLGSEGDAP